MSVAREPTELPEARRAVAVGTFDGVHRGHLHVIDTARTAGLTLDEIRILLADGEQLGAIAARRLAALDAQRTWLAHAVDCTCVDLDDCALFA